MLSERLKTSIGTVLIDGLPAMVPGRDQHVTRTARDEVVDVFGLVRVVEDEQPAAVRVTRRSASSTA